MDNNSTSILEMLEQLEFENKKTVEFLTKEILTANDQNLRDRIGFLLTDYFKAESIEGVLVELIGDKRWKNRNGTLLYLLSECTSNPKYIYFLVDLLLKKENENDGEIYMNGYSMIINLHPPLDHKDITKTLQRVNREDKKETNNEEKKRLINSLRNYLLRQREISKFYSQFNQL